jgi:hypothetical protein
MMMAASRTHASRRKKVVVIGSWDSIRIDLMDRSAVDDEGKDLGGGAGDPSTPWIVPEL